MSMGASLSLSILPPPNSLPLTTPQSRLTFSPSSSSRLPTLPPSVQFTATALELSRPSLPFDLLPVVRPSLAFANLIFSKSTFNVQVTDDQNEPDEVRIDRFRREVYRAGIIPEANRRRFFENKREKKKRKIREAAKRNRIRRPPPKEPEQDKQGASNNEGYNEEDDNWDFVDVELPYC